MPMNMLTASFQTDPLATFPLLRTREVDVARDTVSSKFCPHRLEVPRRSLARFDTRHNHVAGERISLNHLGYGAEVEISPGRLEHFYLIQIPLVGAAQITNGTRSFDVGSGVGSVLNPMLPTRMVWGDGCCKLLVQIDHDALTTLARDCLGVPAAVPVVFDPRIDLSRRPIQDWLVQLARCVKAAEKGRAFGASQYRFQRMIEDELILSFVRAQPSSISHILESPCTRPAGVSHVRRARAFIHDHVAEPYSISDLIDVAGCSLRSLQMGFQSAFGISPQQYITRTRLDLAHARLQLASPGDTVAGIAQDAGFAHMGRFSQTYRQVFGQSPSATLLTAPGLNFDCAGLRRQ